MRRNRAVALAAVCVLSMAAACDKKPQASAAAPQVTLASATFAFFDSSGPISPDKWADNVPTDETTTISLLGELPIQDFVLVYNKNEDPIPLLVKGAPTLVKLGRRPVAAIQWPKTMEEKGFAYHDDITLGDGGRLQGLKLAMYLSAMAKVAGEPAIRTLEREQNISGALLKVGHAIYRSDSTLGTQGPRLSILSTAWRAAFTLRAGRDGEGRPGRCQAVAGPPRRARDDEQATQPRSA